MFQGFTDRTQSFLWDLQFNNERSWFLEHKAEFENEVNTPFKELGRDTLELVRAKYPLSGLEIHISRIYRDARRLFGRGPYKDHLWFSIKNRINGYNGPSMFFELSTRGYCYGMGFYCANATEADAFRKSVDANVERFRTLAKSVSEMSEFHIEGPLYKKPKGDYGDIVNGWYNRKYVSVICERDYDDLVKSDRLPQVLSEAYIKLMPMYDYLNTFCKDYL